MLGAFTSHSALLADSGHMDDGEFVLKIVAIGGGLCIAAIWMLLKAVREVSIKRESEKTKREIAAYVAEGSISPQDAAALLNAGSEDQVAEITSAVAAGIISPAKAEKLIASLRSEVKSV